MRIVILNLFSVTYTQLNWQMYGTFITYKKKKNKKKN